MKKPKFMRIGSAIFDIDSIEAIKIDLDDEVDAEETDDLYGKYLIDVFTEGRIYTVFSFVKEDDCKKVLDQILIDLHCAGLE